MNCKPGDLAVIVRSRMAPEVIGKIVRVIEFAPSEGRPALIIDRRVIEDRHFDGRIRDGRWFFDECLRPIRDQYGEDEILRIAGKPKAKERA